MVQAMYKTDASILNLIMKRPAEQVLLMLSTGKCEISILRRISSIYLGVGTVDSALRHIVSIRAIHSIKKHPALTNALTTFLFYAILFPLYHRKRDLKASLSYWVT